MGKTNNNNKSLLSSWKEIAAYLDCEVRTCNRWEKKLGLPVHRKEGMGKSWVYAYKEELDAWLGDRLKNGTKTSPGVAKPNLWRLVVYVTMPILGVGMLLWFFVFNADPSPDFNALRLNDLNIITAEPNAQGKLRVWGETADGQYENIWLQTNVQHSSVAIGDIDDDGRNEIVAPGVCAVNYGGNPDNIGYKIFLNVYKEKGKPIWNNVWRTSFYSDSDCIFERNIYWHNEIVTADLDGEAGDEIVVMTLNKIGVFKYNQNKDEIELLASRDRFLDDHNLSLRALAVANLDDDSQSEILISANEIVNEKGVNNRGWILVFKLEDNWPRLVNTIEADANVSSFSLRGGNIRGSDHQEIFAVGFRLLDDLHYSYVLGWDAEGTKFLDHKLYETGSPNAQYLCLDVGEVLAEGLDEVIVASNEPDEISLYSWDGDELEREGRHPLPHQNIFVTNVYISDVDFDSSSRNNILVCGGKETGGFYLEVFGFEQDFASKWLRISQDEEEYAIRYAAWGSKRK